MKQRFHSDVNVVIQAVHGRNDALSPAWYRRNSPPLQILQVGTIFCVYRISFDE